MKPIVPHMAMAQEYGGVLQQLQSVWDNLSLLGQLAGGGIDISNTRHAFSDLASDLLNQLGMEGLNKCLQDARSKAQVAINILVRNLFERTADIGFLACDEDIRAFLRNRGAPDQDDALRALRTRFGEYVRKYSVYSDVVLLDPAGCVVARLDDTESIAVSLDPIVREAIGTSAGYVERFGETDLVSARKKSLIYAFRVGNDDGSVLGVLCLIFRFENEMDLIFSKLVNKDDWAIVTVLDAAGVVIASSDPIHMPLGVTLSPVLDADYQIVKFGPMEYIATSRAAKPYQGYGGPPWYGHVMVPVHHAFDQNDTQARPDIEADMLGAIAHSSDLFSDAVRNIPAKAECILRELNQSLWNGRMSQAAVSKSGAPDFSRVLLKEISDTGARTKDVFSGSIGDLHQTVVTSLLRDNQSQAALAIDIMDRNLYERANDCRWWALASVFSELLSSQQRSDQDGKTIGSVLRAINDLYTVYTNLIVFDRKGRVVAISDKEKNDLVGSVLEGEWVPRVLALRDAQDYVVSEFAPSQLYDGRSTYIYGAAILSANQQQAVGGVAIVFDAEPQFAAMLKDALPRDSAGNSKNGAFGVFVEPGGRVIACSDERFRPGDRLPLEASLLQLDGGCGRSAIVALGDVYYAVGANASAGYREYKDANAAYQNDVVALIFTRLCGADARQSEVPCAAPSVRSDRTQAGAKEDIATFRVGRRWLAVRTREILETIDGSNIVPLPCMPTGMIGCVMYRGSALSVFDLGKVAGQPGGTTTGKRPSGQIVVMTLPNETRFGLLVEDLGEIVEVLVSRLAPLPPMMMRQEAFADTVVACGDADEGGLLLVLSAERFYGGLSDPAGRMTPPEMNGRRTASVIPIAKSA
ncbi:MAG TPA: chemotaxis protein CheW [Xanthobacteraceae bacterium]|nr:chemotaxis protein CheW [Xanthobacteraceae bacterium]